MLGQKLAFFLRQIARRNQRGAGQWQNGVFWWGRGGIVDDRRLSNGTRTGKCTRLRLAAKRAHAIVA